MMHAREAELIAQTDVYEHEIARIREKLPRLRFELAAARAGLSQVRKAIRAYTGVPGRRTKSTNPDRTPSPQAKGGHARAQSMTPEERTAVARKAGKARWAKAGTVTEGPSR